MTIYPKTVFEWPLDESGVGMRLDELMGSVIETVVSLNRLPEWPKYLYPPMPRDIDVDRRKRVMSAACEWRWKSEKEIREQKEEHDQFI